jgi:hypothetical protein
LTCATGGEACGANGVGAMIVAPGDPVPGVSGALTVACGANRLRTCAGARAGAVKTIPTATTAAALRQNVVKPRPDMAIFLDLNRGNFKPP